MNPIEIVPLPAFADNYLWALRRGKAVAIVDPGDAGPVLDYLDRHDAQLCAILVTHHHRDHIGGIAALLARRPVPVFGPARENIAGVDHPLDEGDRVELAELGLDFQVMTTPGHTLGHIVYYRRGHLFCGDLLFGAGCGRLFEGTPEQMQPSLARVKALPADTLFYCAHEYTQVNLRFAAAVEPDNAAIQTRIDEAARLRATGLPTLPATLGGELATNPFLRWDAPAVIAAATARLGHAPAGPVATFGAIRAWRNEFR